MSQQFKLATNEANKATELPLWRIGGSVQQNPHMRAFWGSTISFFLAFLGWFALAPLALDVAQSMEICENQKFPPTQYPTRKAFLKFKNLKSKKTYCQYGRDDKDKPTDCNNVPDDIVAENGCLSNDESIAMTDMPDACMKYRPKVLTKCVCTAGTDCKKVLGNAGTAAVSSTIAVRVALGTLLERFGPVNVQSCLLTFGAFWVALSAAITAPWNYTLIRFFIGCAGATFVTNQFWCSLMFAPNIVGTANATAAGWGNLGGGVTQVFMVWCLFKPFDAIFDDKDAAWRVSMIVPAVMFLVVAAGMKLLCWDTPLEKRFVPTMTGKSNASLWDYVECLKDLRVIVMIFQYSACFGTELAMNNQLATHFRTYFQMDSGDASALASSFGGMNLFARSLGGIGSDVAFKLVGFPGRIWVHFLALFFEGIFLFAFGSVTNDNEWYVALIVLICFSLFVQAAEGTSYGIVPFMNKEHLAIVSALVGAGGNLGAMIAGLAFYNNSAFDDSDELLPFKFHAGYVMFWALLTPVYYWPHLGGMFVGPRAGAVEEAEAKAGDSKPQAVEASA